MTPSWALEGGEIEVNNIESRQGFMSDNGVLDIRNLGNNLLFWDEFTFSLIKYSLLFKSLGKFLFRHFGF